MANDKQRYIPGEIALTKRMSRREFTKVLGAGALALAAGVGVPFSTKDKVTWAAQERDSLVTRAVRAAHTRGWRQLGVLDTSLWPSANFRESDILYDPDDGMYYVFSTEGDGNPPTPTPIISSTKGALTTILAPGNHLKAGMKITISGHLKNGSNKVPSELNNGPGNDYYRVSAVNMVKGMPGAIQLTFWSDPWRLVPSTGGHGGQINYLPDPHIAMRRASTPEGITRAGGGDYVEYISSGVWYPTIIKEGIFGGSDWHLWGTVLWHDTHIPTVAHTVLKANQPGPTRWPQAEGAMSDHPLMLGDISVRRNPADGYWYAVGLYGNSVDDMRVYRCENIATSNNWDLVGAVFANGLPAWATYLPDPNICFADGRAYVMFTGGTRPGAWSTGIVEIDILTGQAIGEPEILLRYGAYPSWMTSVLSDLVYVPRGHDGVDRIFAFGGAPYFSGQNATWGCLDLND